MTIEGLDGVLESRPSVKLPALSQLSINPIYTLTIRRPVLFTMSYMVGREDKRTNNTPCPKKQCSRMLSGSNGGKKAFEGCRSTAVSRW